MSKVLTREEWFRRRRRKRILFIVILLLLLLGILILSLQAINRIYYAGGGHSNHRNNILHKLEDRLLGYNNDGIETVESELLNELVIKQDFLTPNEYSRPQIPLVGVEGIVLHYTANPGTTAANNRSYFESLAKTHATSVSSHYIIGLEGEVIQCVPLTEISYASNERNVDTIAIECCIPDETGKFNEGTYASAVRLAAALCVQYDLSEADIIRHYDVTGKCCPKYFVEHEDAWETYKADVMAEVEELKMVKK